MFRKKLTSCWCYSPVTGRRRGHGKCSLHSYSGNLLQSDCHGSGYVLPCPGLIHGDKESPWKKNHKETEGLGWEVPQHHHCFPCSTVQNSALQLQVTSGEVVTWDPLWCLGPQKRKRDDKHRTPCLSQCTAASSRHVTPIFNKALKQLPTSGRRACSLLTSPAVLVWLLGMLIIDSGPSLLCHLHDQCWFFNLQCSHRC